MYKKLKLEWSVNLIQITNQVSVHQEPLNPQNWVRHQRVTMEHKIKSKFSRVSNLNELKLQIPLKKGSMCTPI